MNPEVSIIIPTYNRRAALAELLEALLRQTYRNFEVIIVNDAGESVDKVIALYKSLNIKRIDFERNAKHVHARNAGLRVATGNWIMLCDDDDILLPDHIERMLQQSSDADLLYSDVEIVHYAWNDDHTMRIPRSRRLFAYHYDAQGMREFSTFVSSGCLYRRAVHERIGEFDHTMYHYWDWDFILRVEEAALRIKRVPVASALYAFADAAGSNLSDDLTDMRSYLDKLCDKHGLGYLPTKNFYLLLEEPGVRQREATSEIIWDGSPIRSRWSVANNTR